MGRGESMRVEIESLVKELDSLKAELDSLHFTQGFTDLEKCSAEEKLGRSERRCEKLHKLIVGMREEIEKLRGEKSDLEEKVASESRKVEKSDETLVKMQEVSGKSGEDSPLKERENCMPSRNYFPKFDRPFRKLIYPKGDPDAVTIRKIDVDCLLPDTYLNCTIIDFYIKYLKTRLNVDERTKFHFFNCYFFRKLADPDNDPSSAFDGKAAFQRVRKWTRKVNYLEKDFIVIPVNYSLHWSLIIICYFGEVASYEVGDDNSGRVPCILHMDSLRGTGYHSGLKDLMQSYLWEEWKERQKGTCEDLCSKFRNLKFVPLEVPQQQNLFDCGLFLLHYVELFLEEVPPNFNIYKITSSVNFLQESWFRPAEPSIKRTHIKKLISGLLSKSKEPQSGPPEEDLNTTHGFEDDIQLAVKSNHLDGFQDSSICQVGKGIEMTLLPSVPTRSTQCTGTSALVLEFEHGSAPESFTHASWGALESGASIIELNNHAPLTEGEAKAECFISTELDEHDVFQHPHGADPTLVTSHRDSGSHSSAMQSDGEVAAEKTIASSPAAGNDVIISESDDNHNVKDKRRYSAIRRTRKRKRNTGSTTVRRTRKRKRYTGSTDATPKNLEFIIRLSVFLNTKGIPKKFAVDAGIPERMKLVIVDEKGQEWSVTVTDRGGKGRYCMGAGFFQYLRSNDVKGGSTILFKLIHTSEDAVTVKAQVTPPLSALTN